MSDIKETKETTKAIIEIIQSLPEAEKEKLLYIAKGMQLSETAFRESA